jgi:hypothetical protein
MKRGIRSFSITLIFILFAKPVVSVTISDMLIPAIFNLLPSLYYCNEKPENKIQQCFSCLKCSLFNIKGLQLAYEVGSYPQPTAIIVCHSCAILGALTGASLPDEIDEIIAGHTRNLYTYLQGNQPEHEVQTNQPEFFEQINEHEHTQTIFQQPTNMRRRGFLN